MTFIIHFKDGHRETYNNRYDGYMRSPEASYIEEFQL